MTALIDPTKFKDPVTTARGETRARVAFNKLETLWFNTGSLCNIECENCYILSSPTADHFVYLSPDDMAPYLDEVEDITSGPIEIAFTGGEPYMNPDIFRVSEMALERGHSLLILTNAMKPLMRPRVQDGVIELNKRFPGKMTLRVSLDHFSEKGHDAERGKGSFSVAMKGMDWLSRNDVTLNIAGRAMFSEDEATARAGYAELISEKGWDIEALDPSQVILFPEMDETVDVPEITTACWDILGVSPHTMMCSSSRMVVRRKGDPSPCVLACTLLWDDDQFETGKTLTESLDPVALNHPHCAKFCVLGGASCSA